MQEEIKEKVTAFTVVHISQGLSCRGIYIITDFNLSIAEFLIFRVEYFRLEYNLTHARLTVNLRLSSIS